LTFFLSIGLSPSSKRKKGERAMDERERRGHPSGPRKEIRRAPRGTEMNESWSLKRNT